jgi:uncharacterized membrane protein (DUF373 family)
MGDTTMKEVAMAVGTETRVDAQIQTDVLSELIQARVVILIALLALSRKVIILEVDDLTPTFLAALGILGFSLGATYWLLRETRLRPWRDATGIIGEQRRGERV